MISLINRLHFCAILTGIMMLTGCASTAPIGEARYQLNDFEKPGTTDDLTVSDPLEPMNKTLYRFNYYFDSFLFIPVVEAYQFVMPDFAEQGVSNFLDNIGEIGNLFNGVLQLKPETSLITLSRLTINSTAGFLGFLDPASEWGLQRQDQDFGQTLGHYGVGNGPYLVLPVLGPSNLRDTAGLIVDAHYFSNLDPLNFKKNKLEVPYYALYAIDARKRMPFRYFQSGSPFEYEFIRLLYTAKRKLQVAK